MSICQFSPESDIYAYASNMGITIYVAAQKPLGEIPQRPVIGTIPIEEFIAAYHARSKFFEDCEYKAIGLPHDGDLRTFTDAETAIKYLETLKAEGYMAPDYVFDEVKKKLA